MPARVTPDEVKEIFDTAVAAPVIEAFITTANTFIDANLSDSGLSEVMLTEIEKYLAAHFLCLRDPRAKSENIAGEYSVTYQVSQGGIYGISGLASSEYGQTALALDTTGTLGRLNQRRATFKPY